MSTAYEIMVAKKISEKSLEEIAHLIKEHSELGYWTMSEFVRLVSRGKRAKE